MEEMWKPINDFPEYDASNTGRIRNRKTGRILKTCTNQKGYESLSLRRDGKQHRVRINRIMANAFYEGEVDGLDVRYKDGNVRNNSIDNLEVCTRKENVHRAISRGTFKLNNFGKTSTRVKCVETGEIYNSINECSKVTGADHSEINKYISGKIKYPPKGLHFERVD